MNKPMISRRAASVVFMAFALGLAVSAAPARPSYPGANLLLITIDTLRADRLGAYGYGAARTPVLDGLAARGMLFEQAFSPTPLTLPAHSTLMTSVYPAVHGVRDNGSSGLSTDVETLAERLAAAGYETGAFVAAYVLDSRWGLARGFDSYDDDFGRNGVQPAPLQTARTGDKVVDAALPWLLEERDAPFFGWVHLYDPHAPYDPPEPQSSQNNHAYDGEVAFVDSLIGRLLDGLELAGVAGNTVIIVTSDHGEGLLDHGEPGHGLFLYDTTIHVPLLVLLPDGAYGGHRVRQQVRLMDVAPTALELLSVDVPPTFAGASMIDLVGNPGAPERWVYAETYYPRLHYGWSEVFAVRDGTEKYIQSPFPEMYVVADDPGESLDVIDRAGVDLERYRRVIDENRGQPPSPAAPSLTAEEARLLGALGYLSGGAAAPSGPLADPKDKLEVFVMLNEAQASLLHDDAAAAVEILEGVVAREPHLVDGLVGLGNARMETRDYQGAVDAYADAVRANPQFAGARGNLANAYRRIGALDDAKRELEEVLRLDPTAALARFHLGEIALQQNNPRTALDHFEIGAESSPGAPEFAFGRGIAFLQLDERERARDAFEVAAAAAPKYPELHYYMGVLAEQEGDPDAAIDHYRAEVEARPLAYRSWHNMAVLYSEGGRHTEAAEGFARAIAAQPLSAVGYLYLGRSLLALNDPDRLPEVAAAARRGLSLEPPIEVRPLGHALLAEYYRRTGQPELAEQEEERARQAERQARRIRGGTH